MCVCVCVCVGGGGGGGGVDFGEIFVSELLAKIFQSTSETNISPKWYKKERFY